MHYRASGLLLLSLVVPQAVAEGDKRSELETLREQIGELQSSLEQDREKKRTLLQELEDTERQIGRVAKAMRDLDSELASAGRALGALRDEVLDREKKLRAQRHVLAGHLRSAFVFGRQERLKLLLNQDDPGLASRIMAYHAYATRARAEGIRDVQRQVEELRAARDQVVREQNRLAQLRAERQLEHATLQQAKGRRETLVARIDQSLTRQGAVLTALERDAQALSDLIDRLDRAEIGAAAETHKPISGLKGNLAWPVKGRLSASFGSRRSGSGLNWDGVVIAAAEGSEVRAIHHGRVAFADWLRGFGLLMILDHGDGYMTLYGFNQSLLKETGEWVESGETIALVGDSGGRTHAGLYFGVRHEGRPQNPRQWCRRMTGRRTG